VCTNLANDRKAQGEVGLGGLTSDDLGVVAHLFAGITVRVPGEGEVRGHGGADVTVRSCSLQSTRRKTKLHSGVVHLYTATKKRKKNGVHVFTDAEYIIASFFLKLVLK
jgi:hypothetical protein